jgi:hypothetical protein
MRSVGCWKLEAGEEDSSLVKGGRREERVGESVRTYVALKAVQALTRGL